MSKTPSLNIDLADKTAIKDKLPEVRRLVESKQQAVEAAEETVVALRRELAQWGALLDQLCVLAGVKPFEDSTRLRKRGVKTEGRQSIQQQVIDIVNGSTRVMTTMDVALAIGTKANRDTVNYSLWQAAKNEKIQRVGTGRYASLSYEPTQDELRLSENGSGKK